MNKRNLLISTFVLFSFRALAQQAISLKESIDTAYKNNLEIRGQNLNAAYLEKIKNTGYTIPKTDASVEYGNFNSYYNDTKFVVGQTINFPTVYKRQKELLNEEWKSGTLNIDVKKTEIRRRVTEVFYDILYFQEKKKLLLQSDSLYLEFLTKATLRFQKGETNILEKTTAETQRNQVALQLQQLNEDIKILQRRFQYLLNTETEYLPEANSYKLQLIPIGDTNILKNHPQIKWLQQQLNIASAQTKLEKSKLAPDLSLAYNNQSFVGFQNINGTDKYFSGDHRFSSVQAGIGIPIFSSAQKSRINAAKINQQLVENNYQVGLQMLNNKYQEALGEYQKYLRAVDYYESSALPNTTVIANTANIQFSGGDINYLEWALLINQVITIRSEYIEAVRNLNTSVIQLNNYLN
jgi:cobalt-zinc-cadmium resistance protein CzcA